MLRKKNGLPTTLRSRNEAARVSNEELFFDLVYAFSVTQLSTICWTT
jgi:low temperature requirement protein LtrA